MKQHSTMKHIAAFLTTMLFAAAGVEAKPLKVFVLAGQSNMEGQAKIKAFGEAYRAKLITPEEEAMWKRGASNAGYHYLGCAKTFALMGKNFAEANLAMMKQQIPP
jgi:hypothetical protein